MPEYDIEARPVFTRWQVQCRQCGIYFYVDTEPEATKEDFTNLEDMKCGEHPREDNVLELV
jgi:hypothetical protein